MIKVLQVTGGISFRGLEKQQLEWLKNISSNIQFDFISPSRNTYQKFENEIKTLGSDIYDTNIDKNNNINKLKYIFRLYRFLRKNKYDVVHINTSAFILSFSYVLVSKLTHQKKIIVHSHNNNFDNIKSFRKVIFNLLNPLYNKMIDEVITCSDKATYSLLKNKYIKKRNIYILKNGINIDEFKYNKKLRNKYIKEYNLKDKVVYGHVGAFDKVKNHEYLINLFYKIQKQQDSILLLIGEGPLLNDIKNKVIELNIEDKVLFLGFKDNINEILNCIDIFILPSFTEGLGIAAIEAQTNGLITYCSKGIPEEAKISPHFRFFDLNDNIDELANKIINEKKIERKNAYKYTIENGYDIKNACKQLEQIYLKD